MCEVVGVGYLRKKEKGDKISSHLSSCHIRITVRPFTHLDSVTESLLFCPTLLCGSSPP